MLVYERSTIFRSTTLPLFYIITIEHNRSEDLSSLKDTSSRRTSCAREVLCCTTTRMDHDSPDVQGNPYDVIDGSGSVRGTSKPRRAKHSTEITCNALVFTIFCVGVASILLGIFLAFFATIQTIQAGVACMLLLVLAFSSHAFSYVLRCIGGHCCDLCWALPWQQRPS